MSGFDMTEWRRCRLSLWACITYPDAIFISKLIGTWDAKEILCFLNRVKLACQRGKTYWLHARNETLFTKKNLQAISA
jgi:hypothetical protein